MELIEVGTASAVHEPCRASARASHAAARDSEDEGGEEMLKTDEEVAPKRRDKGKGRAIEVFDSSDEEEDDVETSEDDASDWEESRKKTKKSKLAGKKGGKGGGASVKGKGGRKGKDIGGLEVMKSLPLELLVEIFSHLDPNDLLALSMVNKQYRSLLTSPGSVKIWETSRRTIDLPDLGMDEITEWQYAQLVFGRECQRCGAKGVKKLDVYLRKRLCKRCRVQEFADLVMFVGECTDATRVAALSSSRRSTVATRRLSRSFTRVRQTASARLPTPNPGSQSTSGSSKKRVRPSFALRSWVPLNLATGLVSIDDLYTMSNILRRFEEQDEDEAIAEGRSSPPPEARVRKPGSSKRKKPVVGASSKTWRTIDDDEKDEKDWESARVVNYVRARAATFDKFRDVTEKLAKAADTAAKYLDSKPRYSLSAWWEKPQEYEWPKESRRKQIADRVASLGYKRHEVEKIKAKVLKSLERARTTAKEAQLRRPRVNAQQSLKPYYTALKASLSAAEQPFVPLFIDFLLLPSVKELWMTGENVSSGDWLNQLNAIKADLEEYRLDLILHARELILDATTERDEEEGAAEDVDGGMSDFDDEFFSRATSMLCCAFPGCPPATAERRRLFTERNARGRLDYRYTYEPTLKDRQGSFGSLVDVLKHLHADHNKGGYVSAKHKWKKAPQYHLALPLEIACTVSALLDVHDLDPATAAKEDLVCAVKRKGEKLGKLKPPVALDPPCIVMRRRGGGENA
uniref:FGENESH: predicted gene_3.232 protein n=1 Tax=Rhodotorula toruloides TaxID=5286 RepID=A0A0K3CBK7_RHOTO